MADRLDLIPEAAPAPHRRHASAIWLVPVAAAAIGIWLAARAIIEKGPDVTITFATADGLDVGKTTIRYRSTVVGLVRKIELTKDRKGVVVTARMERAAEPLLVDGTRFWVVRPRIDLAGVSGLGTLLSGSYIAVDPGPSTTKREAYAGLDQPPTITSDVAGKRFVLKGDDLGSLDVASPVFLRRKKVGQVTSARLDRTGVTVEIFVDAPYAQYVTTGSRFWHESGVDLSFDARGLKVETQSVLSILVGGVAFEGGPTDGKPAAGGAKFKLFRDREAATRQEDQRTERYALRFERSVRGLAVGAPVDLLGLNIGEVKSVDLELDPVKAGFEAVVSIAIHPDRLHLRGGRPGDTVTSTRALLDKLVARGLRAQLRNANLLTGQLYVGLDFFPRAPPARLDWGQEPLLLPTTGGGLDELQGSLTRILAKIERLPTDQLGRNAVAITEELAGALGDARRTLGAAQQVLSSDGLPRDASDALTELGRAARSLRALTDYLERHPESLLRGKK
jgi:paraquat-inducible protein B